VIDPDVLRKICEMIVEENRRRERAGGKAAWLCYDQVYWQLVFGGGGAGAVRHVTPPEVVPEVAPYTILLDAASKSFAATGLRVGWAVMPPAARQRMSNVLGHIGAWAPRAEQVATVDLLDDPQGIREFHEAFLREVQVRLDLLHRGLQGLKSRGLPVESIPPMGAIYLTARIHPFGRRTPDGQELRTNDDVRKYVLEAAGVGVIPFQAFGSTEDEGWFRLSVGAVSPGDIEAALPRLEEALRQLV